MSAIVVLLSVACSETPTTPSTEVVLTQPGARLTIESPTLNQEVGDTILTIKGLAESDGYVSSIIVKFKGGAVTPEVRIAASTPRDRSLDGMPRPSCSPHRHIHPPST
jgi:hypothetical protein